MNSTESPRQVKTGERNLKPAHFTCDHCNSMIWVEEEEEFPECERCGETTFQTASKQ